MSQQFEPVAGGIKDRVTSGVVVTSGTQAIKVGAQMVSVVVLSRLLSPDQFGVVAMAAPILGLIGLFQDLGLTQAVIQKKSISHDEINELFWVNMAVGVAVAAVLIACAPLAVLFYRNADVGKLLMAMSIIFIISMFGSQQSAILARRMQFTRLAVLDIISTISTLSAAVAFALISPTYWALYAGNIASASLVTIGAWSLAGWYPSRPDGFGRSRSLLNYGAGVTTFNFFNFLARNLDNALIGWRWGEAPLGFYDRAYKLLLFPLQQITGPVGKVMVPALSRIKDETDRYAHAFLRALSLVLLFTLPLVAFLIIYAPILVPFALGDKWSGAVPIFRMLGIAGLVQMLNNTSGWLFLSQGRSKAMAAWGITTAITSAAAFAIGLPFGPVGVAGCYALSELIRTPFLWWLVLRHGPVGKSHLARTIYPIYAGSLLSLAVLYAALPLTAGLYPVLALGLGGLLSYACAITVTALFPTGRIALSHGISFALSLRRLGKRR